MGIFSSKRVIYVDSLVYSLAGERAQRMNYLRSSVSQYALNDDPNKEFVGTLRRVMMEGPGMLQRKDFNWTARNHIGMMPSLAFDSTRSLGGFDVVPYLRIAENIPENSVITVAVAEIQNANHTVWAEQYLLREHPSRIDEDWTLDLGSGGQQVTISFANGDSYVVALPNYSTDNVYLHARYSEDYQAEPEGPWASRNAIWIYRLGAGTFPEIDAFLEQGESVVEPEFFPVLPLRIMNKSIRDSTHEIIEEDVREVFKRLMPRADLDELLDEVEDMEGVGDIDHAHLTFGVQLNTQDTAARKYLYLFFQTLMQRQKHSYEELWARRSTRSRDGLTATGFWEEPPTTTIRVNSNCVYAEGQAKIEAMRDELGEPPSGWFSRIVYTSRLNAANRDNTTGDLDIRLTWAAIRENVYSGKGRADAKTGDVWFGNQSVYPIYRFSRSREGGTDEFVTRLSTSDDVKLLPIYWQTGENTYRVLRIYGMIHRNFIYGGKSVDTDTAEAYSDSEENGFVVPLHKPTLDRMSLLDVNQIALECPILYFNAYTVKKIKWYQRGIFRALISIAVIAIAVVLAPATMGGSLGVLGTAASVGAALGFAGMTAIIVGTIANAVAAMLITTMLTKMATTVFGDQIGAIIGAIASFVAIGVASGMMGPGGLSFGASLGNLFTPDKLLALTNSASSAVQIWAQEKIEGIQADLSGMASSYEDKLEEIAERTQELLGYSGVELFGLWSGQGQDTRTASSIAESPDFFFKRTLMTGSEIVAMSHAYIADFANIGTTLPKPIV